MLHMWAAQALPEGLSPYGLLMDKDLTGATGRETPDASSTLQSVKLNAQVREDLSGEGFEALDPRSPADEMHPRGYPGV